MARLFTETYFPGNLDEFIGNVEIVEEAKRWAQEWDAGKAQKPLVLYGMPGVGKTALAYLIAKEMNWQIFEMNASDLRNKDAMERIAGAATNNSSLFGTKRLVLIDEIDSMQAQDRGGAASIFNLAKTSSNPILFTANNIYSDKKLLPLRSIGILKEFKKINYLSIAKKLREILEKEGVEFDPEAIKELAKNSGGDYRSALLDIQSLGKNITMEDVNELTPRRRKEKIFPIMTKIFKGKTAWEIKEAVDKSEVSPDLLMRWVEENIPRQYEGVDAANAFDYLSKADIFQGRIYRRQHYGFLKYVFYLSTVGVGFAKTKEYHGWKPFQFPTLLSKLSASTSKRALRKSIATKVGAKTHCSIRQGTKDLPFLEVLMTNKEIAPELTYYFDFDDKELAFLLNTKKTTKKVSSLIEKASEIEKKVIMEKTHTKQSKLFG
ncbi:MAG: replication factor C large subunit [Candidatus Diapherotrites archaeon]|jgi:replication factor C large subunit|uniref:Replication factor C large subunit n=1 Tax=Candidatus Iainarchaeum sp. TaxID=3101447 RepID=A0A8T5GF50_9ARCH|nr:replication factor C large subunit [Candidatus Diapherotrites archaeon]MBT7241756.1 replication factor C large subunit [Candidatus Diapherotrites archaeon]